MTKYEFNKESIKRMYDETVDECFERLMEGSIDEINIEIKIGGRFINIPITADNIETIFGAIKECEEDTI